MLDNNNDFFGSLGLELESDTPTDKIEADTESLAKEHLRDISKKTMQILEDENILPFPENFESIFERNLKQETNEEVKNKIIHAREARDYTTKIIALEKNVDRSFGGIKLILESIGVVCKNLEKIEQKTQEKITEIENIENPFASKNAIKILLKDVQSAYQSVFNQIKGIAKSYGATYEELLDMKKNSMYDTTLGIYNKEFFLSQLAKECQIDSDLACNGVLCVIELGENLLKALKDKKSFITTIKMVSKILLDQLGKNDSLCYLGDSEFGVFIRNITESQSQEFIKEMLNILKTSNVYINDEQVNLEVVVGISKFDTTLSVEQNLENTKEALGSAKKENKHFEIYKSQASEDSQEGIDDDFGNFEIPQ
ncbi:diguanylate cyclase domain-containing protein [Helicobacter himalayensis]|uniref:diguanylate cyclase domain-containing protein n=1 Tax=Helicobacter himalayensis TaxID=1591088 RepID=UPI0008316162|nr:diguanylate cyclase [Helicobacter himalayensis]